MSTSRVNGKLLAVLGRTRCRPESFVIDRSASRCYAERCRSPLTTDKAFRQSVYKRCSCDWPSPAAASRRCLRISLQARRLSQPLISQCHACLLSFIRPAKRRKPRSENAIKMKDFPRGNMIPGQWLHWGSPGWHSPGVTP